jgi:tRNA nucleotidyltransferase/poly(A) polymerase
VSNDLPLDPSKIPAEIQGLCERLQQEGHQGVVVGGSIRDILIGREPGDFDVATSAFPEEILRIFGSRFTIPTGVKHGTVTVLLGEGPKKHPVEVTTFRGEGDYHDGRHPESVCFGVTLEEDLSRRDFTMNAIAWDPLSKMLFDPYNGRGDIVRRYIQTVGDPIKRFTEDGLRPLRAVRQATQLEFTIAPDTLTAIERTIDSFRKVAMERIRGELQKILLAAKPSTGIELLRQTGLLAEFLPELLPTVGCIQNRFHKHDVYHHILATIDAASSDWIVRMAALLHDLGKPSTQAPREGCPGEFTFFGHEHIGRELAATICDRLHLSTSEKDLLCTLVGGHMFYYTPAWTDGAVRRFVRKLGPDRLAPLFALREADIASRGGHEDREGETRPLKARIEQLKAQEAALHVTDLALDGHDLMRILQIPPGRRIGQLLDELLEKVLDDPSLNDPHQLESIVRALEAQSIKQ